MYRGSRLLFVSLLMKAWCRSAFLITFTCTHAKQTLAFSKILFYSRELGSLWQQSPGLVCDGFSQLLCTGMLSATLYLPVSFQFLGVLFRCQPLLRPPEQVCWLTFSQTVPCSFSHGRMLHLVSLSLSSTSSPAPCPSWSSSGLLAVEASGLSKQIACRSTLHCS